MKIFVRFSLYLILAVLLLGACAQKEPEQPPAAPVTRAAQPPAHTAPATPPAKQEAAAAPAQPTPAETKPATTAAPAPPAQQPAPAPAKAAAKDVVILKAALGGIRFEHKLHAETRKVACETCHHASRPEKSNASPQQACSACHTTTATAPMKTKLQAAFHNPTATAGTCIDCHKAEVAKGKPAPVKCLDCHKKENK